MKVRLAAQLLSLSVADALAYLQDTNPRFAACGPTITFIRHVSEIKRKVMLCIS